MPVGGPPTPGLSAERLGSWPRLGEGFWTPARIGSTVVGQGISPLLRSDFALELRPASPARLPHGLFRPSAGRPHSYSHPEPSTVLGAWEVTHMKRTAAGAAALAITSVLLGAASAHGNVGVAISGSTLAVTGSAGNDAPQFSYYGAAGPGMVGYTRIFDDGGVNDPLPATCSRNDVAAITQPPEKVAVCEDGGASAQYLARLELTLGTGDDQPYLVQECFDEMVVDAGEGNNTVILPGCQTGLAAVISGAGQDQVTAGTADPPAGVALAADLGAGDDTFTGGDGAGAIHGGAGNDYLVGGGGSEDLFGDDGDDTSLGHGGNDRHDGGAGADVFGVTKGLYNDDDPGNDDYRGGAGADLLVLSNHGAGMTISIDETANDGSPGETDNIHNDIETIEGTGQNDVFTGGPGVDNFDGGGGADAIHGGDGADILAGGGADDTVYGDAGADKVEGENGADTVDGGTGADQIYGDIANCSAFCNFDADTLFARDGERDVVDCGGGADTAQVDSLDVVAFCTVVDRSAPPTSPVPDPDPDPDPGSNPDPNGGVDTSRPSLTALSASPSRFRAASSGGSVGTRAGTTISYALSEAAAVSFRVERVLPGRRVGGRCVKPTQSNRTARRCSRYKLLRGGFRQQGAAGANRLKFTGRLRGTKLRPGKYRLRGVATDAAGNRSSLRRTPFRIVRS